MRPTAERQSTTVHHRLTATPRRGELMGMEGWRIPAVAVQEQVLQNNVGRMYLPEETIQQSAERWNDMPVTLGHPTVRGQPASARTPEFLNQMGLGRLVNAREEDSQLKVDVFLFDHRLEDLGVEEDILETVENGEPVEVSTGFGGTFRREQAEFQNEEYDIVAEWVDPDHFAILLDAEGACSVEDGCGLGMNACFTDRTRSGLAGPGEVSEGEVPESARGAARSILEEEDLLEEDEDDEAQNASDDEPEGIIRTTLRRLEDELVERFRNAFPANQEGLSLDDIRDLVSDELDQRFGAQDRFVYIRELFEDEVVYRIDVQGGEDTLWRAPYEIDTEEEAVEFGERVEVQEVTEFVPTENEKLEPATEYRAANVRITEELTMNRDELIEELADCEECPYERDALEGMEADQLAFVANAADIDVETDEEGGESEGDGDSSGAEAQNAEDTPAWAENLLSTVSDLADRVENVEQATEPVREEREQERRRLASEVAQNSDFSEEELEERPVSELQKIANAVRKRRTDFSGLGGPTRGPSEDETSVEVHNILSGPRGEAVVDGPSDAE